MSEIQKYIPRSFSNFTDTQIYVIHHYQIKQESFYVVYGCPDGRGDRALHNHSGSD